MMMTVLSIIMAVISLLLLLLLIPVTYMFHLDALVVSGQVKVLFGLFHKEISFSWKNEEEEDEVEEPDVSLMQELLQKAESAKAEKEEAKEKDTHRPTGAGQNFFGASEEDDEEEYPSWMEQFRFALHNGLLEKVCHAASCCISHGWPNRWCVSGECGMGDPMETGMISGMTAAFFPKETEGIVWNYIDKSMSLQGSGQGRLIPLYVVYIAVRLLIAKETRQFWHFRQGGTHHE